MREDHQLVARLHWTARVGFYLALFALTCSLLFFWLPQRNLPDSFMEIVEIAMMVSPMLAFLFSGIALFVARHPLWRRGRELASVGLVLSIIVFSCVYEAIISQLLSAH
jgi:ABC-type Fe3+-siderophore transport system permease subunit